MAAEAKRGCGYRKVNGLYLCGSGISVACDRLPYLIEYCPVCGAGIKFTQGFTWIDWNEFAGEHEDCKEGTDRICYLCHPNIHPQPYGLMWVGEAYYSPQSFIKEALGMGVSKRIPFVPKELKLGETVVLLAHKKAIIRQPTEEEMNNRYRFNELPATVPEGQTYEGFKVPDGQKWKVYVVSKEYPAIFYAFKPTTIEMLVYESELTDEKKEELVKRGITAIPIPDGDVDHSDEKVTVAYDPITKSFSKVLLEE